MPSRIVNSPRPGPSYAKGSKVLLSNKVLRSVEGLPSNMIDPMKLLRGRITEVSLSNPRYKVQIWATTPDYMDSVAFGDCDSPPHSSIIVDANEGDIISQLTNGRVSLVNASLQHPLLTNSVIGRISLTLPSK
ncbi:hypothetical protein FRB94_005694 [Tulasnella sp. JGI-2019a]|nr:hypothetical protein FRB94_005694 [Tulasnella sp. JGI-2019a]